MLNKFSERIEISGPERQRWGVLRQFLALELIIFIPVAVLSGFPGTLYLMLFVQFPLSFGVIVYQKLIKPFFRKNTAQEMTSDQEVKSAHAGGALKKFFLTIFKWITITIYIICWWLILYYFWAQWCLSYTESEAGQAMGLLVGVFVVTFGLLLVFIVVGVTMYFRRRGRSIFRRDGMNAGKVMMNFWGLSAFALIAAVLLHEAGHMLGLFLSEGKTAHLTFHPFQGARITYASSHSMSSSWATWGGPLGGSLLGGLVTAVFWRFRSPLTAPFLMIGVAALGGNGLMLTVGALTSTVGDVTRLIALGVGREFLMGAGIIFLLAGFGLFFFLQPYWGMNKGDSLFKRCYIIIGGLLPYILCVLYYNLAYNAEALKNYLAYVTGSLILAFVAAVFLRFLDSMKFIETSKAAVEIRWGHALYSLVLGAASVILCYYFLS